MRVKVFCLSDIDGGDHSCIVKRRNLLLRLAEEGIICEGGIFFVEVIGRHLYIIEGQFALGKSLPPAGYKSLCQSCIAESLLAVGLSLVPADTPDREVSK